MASLHRPGQLVQGLLEQVGRQIATGQYYANLICRCQVVGLEQRRQRCRAGTLGYVVGIAEQAASSLGTRTAMPSARVAAASVGTGRPARTDRA